MSELSSAIVPGIYCGPPGSGNGGYSCGVIAEGIDGPAEVMLKRPVPLDVEMERVRLVDGTVVASEDGEEVGAARPLSLDALSEIVPPAIPDSEAAAEAGLRSPFLNDDHPFPERVVCGPKADPGMRVFAGPLDQAGVAGEVVADRFTIRPDLARAESGAVPAPLLWAALDCPSCLPSFMGPNPVVLGRMSGEILGSAEIGEELVAIAWAVGETDPGSRKRESASAVVGGDGRLIARARATWIQLRAKRGD